VYSTMSFFFSIMYVWLGSVDSHANHDFEIQHLEKIVSWGVNKAIMEHFVKFYKETVLGYMLPTYDGRKSLCIVGPLPFSSKEFQINLLGKMTVTILKGFWIKFLWNSLVHLYEREKLYNKFKKNSSNLFMYYGNWFDYFEWRFF